MLRGVAKANVSNITGTLPVANGGTGATTAQGAMANLGGRYVLAISGAAVNAPGDTSENILATINVPANALGANGVVLFSGVFATTNNGNAKTLRVRAGGIGGTVYTLLAGANFATSPFSNGVQNANSTSAQCAAGTTGAINTQQSTTAIITSSIDTTQAWTIVVTAEKATAGDTVTLRRYDATIVFGT